jgi:hypothetical protein
MPAFRSVVSVLVRFVAGLGLAAVPPQARPFLLLDGFMHVPEVGAASPLGMGLVLVVAVVRQTAYSVLLLDGFMHVPEVGAASPLGMALVLGVLVDSHRPRPSPKAVRQPSSATDPMDPPRQSSQQVGPRPSPCWDELLRRQVRTASAQIPTHTCRGATRGHIPSERQGQA